ncbi:MAG TPA: DNA-processing protein DprA [Candidatus Baltobacteraceae bacterium]|jgi:DNA processing protein|nr:DNA-processing protein DprA [Candidatus Baltobacteraceae bacterium]
MDLDDPRLVSVPELEIFSSRAAAHLGEHPLFGCGSLVPLSGRTLAVVGTRAPSEAGRRLTRRLGEELARAGVCVVSGLAVGIDAAAHEGSLLGGGRTIGVLGGGHRHFFPRTNRNLAERMLAAGGAVLSPFAPEQRPWPPNFLSRNGLVAALADAVLVVEAAQRSGALNTAGWAADLGLPVMAVPGDVDRPKAAGCLALIRDGATLVRHIDDVLEVLGVARPCSRSGESVPPPSDLSEAEMRLLATLSNGERLLDDAVAASGLGTGRALSAVTQLELAGLIERNGHGMLVRVVDGSLMRYREKEKV